MIQYNEMVIQIQDIEERIGRNQDHTKSINQITMVPACKEIRFKRINERCLRVRNKLVKITHIMC